MSEEIEATLITGINGYQECDDGTHILVNCAGGEETHYLAIPVEVGRRVLQGIVAALASKNRRVPNDNMNWALDVDFWQTGTSDLGPVVAFRIPGSGFLDFQIDEDMARGIVDGLRTVLGDTSFPPPEKLQS